ncbi:toxin [Bacillus thuringiensis]|nr:toxin [Bacillus thuringiensis]
MKFISKKVMTGLMVTAMSLSIWTPASQAAVPENNRYYTINLKANPNKIWDVANGYTENGRAILLYNETHGDNQQFVFFQLDGGTYAIVNKNSGKPITFGPDAWFGNHSYPGILMGDVLQQQSWTGAPAEQWYLRDKGSNNYEVVNQGNGRVASYAGVHRTHGWIDYVDLDEPNPSDSNRVFNIANSPSGLSLPTLPATGTRPTAPNYTGGIEQQLPLTSNSVVIGASLIPCIMVNDSQASEYTKIHNSPYYVLIKEEYWEQTFSKVIQPGLSETYSYKTGISSVDQQKMTDTLSIQVGGDLGLKFGDKSASLKAQITKTLQTEVSTTSTQASEETITQTATGEPGKATGYTQYQLVTKYTLKRQDGTTVSNPWVVKNNRITVTRKSS